MPLIESNLTGAGLFLILPCTIRFLWLICYSFLFFHKMLMVIAGRTLLGEPCYIQGHVFFIALFKRVQLEISKAIGGIYPSAKKKK
jgi:hypothetical protein